MKWKTVNKKEMGKKWKIEKSGKKRNKNAEYEGKKKESLKA